MCFIVEWGSMRCTPQVQLAAPQVVSAGQGCVSPGLLCVLSCVCLAVARGLGWVA
jgi:hypothetical protein